MRAGAVGVQRFPETRDAYEGTSMDDLWAPAKAMPEPGLNVDQEWQE
jgi:hypothetical protein